MEGTTPSTAKPTSKARAKKRARTKNSVDTPIVSSAVIEQSCDPQFTCFKKLPPELRRKIWKLVANQGRLIQVKGLTLQLFWSHSEVQVIFPSCRPPAILQACKESRDECMKLYRMIRLNIGRSNLFRGRQDWVYFNPNADIIFFGADSCFTTLTQVLRYGLELPRIAIQVGDSDLCCENALDGGFIPTGTSKVASIMLALHGQHTDDLEHNITQRYPGCKGLREVFWIGEPGLLHPEFDDIDETVELNIDLEFSGARVPWRRIGGEDLKTQMNRFEDGEGLKLVRHNKWTGEHRPSFHVAHLNYYPSAPKVCEVVFLKYTTKPQFRRVSLGSRKFAESIRCRVRLNTSHWIGAGDYAIKITGTIERVRKVKERIATICKMKNRVGGMVTIVDRAEARNPGTRELYQDSDRCSSLGHY